MGLPLNITKRNKFILGQVKGASVAYGLRKLSKSATKAIRVRRSVDNAESDIGFSGKDLDTASLLNFVGVENLIINSEAFGLWSYSTGVSIVSNTAEITDPIATNTADIINENTTSSLPLYDYQQIANCVANTTYTFSCYVKKRDRRYCFFLLRDGTTASFKRYAINIDLDNGDVTTTNAINTPTGTGYSVSAIGSGWYRVSISLTNATAGTMLVAVGNSASASPTWNADGTTSVTGVIGYGTYVWGGQINLGSTAKTYTKTTTAVAGDGYVATWYDQSGNGSNATQSTAGYQPKIVGNGAYLSGMLYDGADSVLSCGTIFNNVVDSTSFAKVLPSSGGETAGRIFDKTAFVGKVLYVDSNLKLNWTDAFNPTAGFWQSTNAVSTASESKVTVTYTKSTSSDAVFYVNGVLAASSEQTTPDGTLIDDSAQTLYIGNNAARARTFAGYINELILYPKICGDGEISKLNK